MLAIDDKNCTLLCDRPSLEMRRVSSRWGADASTATLVAFDVPARIAVALRSHAAEERPAARAAGDPSHGVPTGQGGEDNPTILLRTSPAPTRAQLQRGTLAGTCRSIDRAGCTPTRTSDRGHERSIDRSMGGRAVSSSYSTNKHNPRTRPPPGSSA